MTIASLKRDRIAWRFSRFLQALWSMWKLPSVLSSSCRSHNKIESGFLRRIARSIISAVELHRVGASIIGLTNAIEGSVFAQRAFKRDNFSGESLIVLTQRRKVDISVPTTSRAALTARFTTCAKHLKWLSMWKFGFLRINWLTSASLLDAFVTGNTHDSAAKIILTRYYALKRFTYANAWMITCWTDKIKQFRLRSPVRVDLKACDCHERNLHWRCPNIRRKRHLWIDQKHFVDHFDSLQIVKTHDTTLQRIGFKDKCIAIADEIPRFFGFNREEWDILLDEKLEQMAELLLMECSWRFLDGFTDIILL